MSNPGYMQISVEEKNIVFIKVKSFFGKKTFKFIKFDISVCRVSMGQETAPPEGFVLSVTTSSSSRPKSTKNGLITHVSSCQMFQLH